MASASARAKASARPSARLFLLKALLWLPLCFAVWYLLASVLVWPVLVLSSFLLETLFPYAVETLEQQGYLFDVVTVFDTPAETAGGKVGQVVFTINALKYAYGVPLLLAMLLAVPERISHTVKSFVIGFGILILTQVWGVCFEILIALVFKLGPDIAEQMRTSTVGRELMALGYQLGYLILPAVTPLLIWLATQRRFIAELAPGLVAPTVPAVKKATKPSKRSKKAKTTRTTTAKITRTTTEKITRKQTKKTPTKPRRKKKTR